jgi:magnesium transporter
MIRLLYFKPAYGVRSDLTLQDLPAILQESEGVVWVDFEDTPPETDEPILRELFGFHPLAIDDALQETHVPKVDDWGPYLYIVLEAVYLDDNSRFDELAAEELDVFLGRQYMVTHHNRPIRAVETLWQYLQRDDRLLRNGADALLYRLTDDVVAGFMPIFERLDDEIDHTEDELFNHPTSETLERIFAIKRAIVHLRRIIAPQREVLNRLARDDYGPIDAQARVYFRDVYDHLVRQYEITETLRDLIGGSLDTYLSVVNNRMNEIMRTLTVITTLFMPLTFVVGFFGMNFFAPVVNLRPWTDSIAFMLSLAIMAATPILMYWWMRHRGWF